MFSTQQHPYFFTFIVALFADEKRRAVAGFKGGEGDWEETAVELRGVLEDNRKVVVIRTETLVVGLDRV